MWFPKGGTGALVQGLLRLFTDLGGRIRLNAPVDRITTAGGRATGVLLQDGTAQAFDLVASNGDVHTTYDKMLRDEPLAKGPARSLAKRRWSMSLFVIYFGAKKKYDNVAHHTVIFGPRYKELIGEIFKGPELAQDFSLYLHRPTASDPDLAPAGCDGFYVLSPVPHLGSADLDWAHEGPLYRDRILDFLEEKLMPGLRENLVTSRITLHPLRLPRRAGRLQGQRLLAGADPDAERLVPRPQPRRPDQGPVPRGRRHPPGRGRARRGGLGQGHGGADDRRRGNAARTHPRRPGSDRAE